MFGPGLNDSTADRKPVPHRANPDVPRLCTLRDAKTDCVTVGVVADNAECERWWGFGAGVLAAWARW